jgi:hypothetical protein
MTTQTQNNFDIEESLKFETTMITNENFIIPLKNAYFGILNLQANSTPLSTETHELIIMVDCSGSMSDECSDGRNKMQHIIHTLKNIVLYFKENPVIHAYLTIHSFDDTIREVIPRSNITNENFNSIIDNINLIVPRLSTNIELALINVKEVITQLEPSHNICTIFMTDGEATSGVRRAEILKELVDTSVKNIFVGFGIGHDSYLLNTLSSGKKSEYYFIDKLENSGFVYGEIIHGIVYKLLSNIEVSIENGLIYNYKENKWVESIYIGEITSEQNKIYNVITCDPNNCCAHLTGSVKEYLIDYSISAQDSDEDLTKYIYRQRTLTHLCAVTEFLERKKSKNFGVFKFNHLNDKEEEKNMKETLYKFLQEMKEYMKDKNILEDAFIKNLCDDIYISYKTLGTKYGNMFNIARRTSQGNQRCYTVNQLPDTLNLLKEPSSSWRVPRIFDEEDKEDFEEKEDDFEHELSNVMHTPYSTRGSSQLMRDISCKNI